MKETLIVTLAVTEQMYIPFLLFLHLMCLKLFLQSPCTLLLFLDFCGAQ